MGTGGPFTGGKTRPERDTDYSPPSSAEFKNEQELYLLSPLAPPWRVAGQLTFLLGMNIADQQKIYTRISKRILCDFTEN
jgi:hypothetical protein